MNKIIAILFALILGFAPVASQAHDQEAIDTFGIIANTIIQLANRHHHPRYYEDYDGPPPEYYADPCQGGGHPQDCANEQQYGYYNAAVPHAILTWLAENGEPGALIVGRRNEDCDPASFGGWAVVLHHHEPVSGVVCVQTPTGPFSLRVDK